MASADAVPSPYPPSARRGSAGAFEAIVLAGGQGARVGGAGKPGLRVGERTLLEWVTSAARSAGATRVIVVGPPRPVQDAEPGWLVFTREDQPGGGPVPALRAALPQVTAPVVAVLAADLPFLRARHLIPLVTVVRAGHPGAVMLDHDHRRQWLAGCWRTPVLARAAASYQGDSLGGLLGPLEPAMIHYHQAPGEPPPWLDCDTAADLAQARRWQQVRDREAGR